VVSAREWMASASIAELPEITETMYFITAIVIFAPRAKTIARSELLSFFIPVSGFFGNN